MQQRVDELEWGDPVAWQALEPAEAKVAGGK
jgi:hypothetical protein